MRYSGFGFPSACVPRIKCSASCREKSTEFSGEFSFFSRISRRFSASSVVVSLIDCLKAAVFVMVATWVGVLAEPVMVENVALLVPERSQL